MTYDRRTAKDHKQEAAIEDAIAAALRTMEHHGVKVNRSVEDSLAAALERAVVSPQHGSYDRR